MDALAKEASGLRHLRWAREILASVEAHIEHNPRLSAGDREALREEAGMARDLVARLSSAVKAYRDFLERTRVGFRARQRVGSFLGEEARSRLAAQLEGAESGRFEAEVADLAAAVMCERSRAASLPEHRRDELEAERAASLLRSLRELPASHVAPSALVPVRELAADHEEAAALLRAHNDAFARMEEEQRRPLKATLRSAITALREGLDGMSLRLRDRMGEAFVESLYPKLAAQGTMVADEDDEDDDASAPPDAAEKS